MNILVEKVSSRAILPKKVSSGAAGFDIYACENKIIYGRENDSVEPFDMVDTGIKIVIPDGWYGRIAPRSSLGIYLPTFGK